MKLVRGNHPIRGFVPNEIEVTSLFTYWSENVKGAVQYYKRRFPKARITVGGVYASLMPEHCKDYTGCDEVFVGIHEEAEQLQPDYELVDVDYQIIHSSRGCIRKCKFCGVWRIEQKFHAKKSILGEICRPKLVFYDNNMLANPNIENILTEISEFRLDGRRLTCESQSGFDGRVMTPKIARLLRKARFINPRIAWDNKYSDHPKLKRQIKTLNVAGYPKKDLYVFMVYNWDYDFRTMERKRKKCWDWKVQISDCRFRPLDQTIDHYNPRLRQTSDDYFIHDKWTDEEVKQFRKNVRRQNICVRHEVPFHSSILERKGLPRKEIQTLKKKSRKTVERILEDAWYPEDFSPPPFKPRLAKLEDYSD